MALKDVALRKALEAHFREGMRSGAVGMLWGEVMVARPWGFPLREVATEVRLWHGADDPVPLDRAELVADRLPLSRLTVWPGEGALRIHPPVGRGPPGHDRGVRERGLDQLSDVRGPAARATTPARPGPRPPRRAPRRTPG
jgi:hypothetical protein